jgi:hypothetical protein
MRICAAFYLSFIYICNLLTTLPQQSYHLVLKYGSKLQNTQIREESLKGKSEAVSRRGTDNAMVKRRNQFSTKHYLENHKLTSMDPTNIPPTHFYACPNQGLYL